MSEKEKSLTVDNNTSASNPGAMLVDYWCWIKHQPTAPVVLGLAVLGSAALASLVSNWYWLLFMLMLFVNRFYWARVKEQFIYGCINPSVVISVSPLLIATYTDLSKGIGEFPAIKIINPSLRVIAGQKPQVGMPVATISLYQSAAQDNFPHWADFNPIPAEYGTQNIREHQRILATLTPADYQELQQYLEKVPTPDLPGVYYMFE